jgi:hypothetical protein
MIGSLPIIDEDRQILIDFNNLLTDASDTSFRIHLKGLIRSGAADAQPMLQLIAFTRKALKKAK